MSNHPQAQIPNGFPGTAPEPLFQLGDRVRWRPSPNSDVGVIIGLQYLPTKESGWQQWAWKYLVWLDLESYSRSWTTGDTAWEPDLESFADVSRAPLTHREEA